MDGLTSTEGAAIPRVYGRARIGGQLIWATRFEEVVSKDVQCSGTSGGKGFGAPAAPKTVVKTYSYFANLAVGLCEGPIGFVRRVWADGRELDTAKLGMRVHRGTESQDADPLIVAKEGADNAPAYRGLAYVVFERGIRQPGAKVLLRGGAAGSGSRADDPFRVPDPRRRRVRVRGDEDHAGG
jgi:hypothetical protein